MLLPRAVASNERFAAQLVEAKRLRSELVPAGANAAALDAVGLLSEAPLIGWDDSIHHVRTALTTALGLANTPLEELHEHIDAFSPSRASHKRVMIAKERLLKRLTSQATLRPFTEAFESMILECCAPQVSEAMPTEDTELWFPVVPTLRVQTPSDEIATIRPHVDGMYDLPDGSMNFWVPLTEVSDHSALWVESEPGLEDFHPLKTPSRFDGRRCMHFTLPNRSSKTRVSLDFRCVPGAYFDPNCRLATLGYFSSCGRDGPRAPFTTRTVGTPSKLHGMPFK